MLVPFRLRTLFVVVGLLAAALAIGTQWSALLGILFLSAGLLALSEFTSGNRGARRWLIFSATFFVVLSFLLLLPQQARNHEYERRAACQNNIAARRPGAAEIRSGAWWRTSAGMRQ
jgi:hypothetical protein